MVWSRDAVGRQLKSAIMCHETKRWVDVLPTVRLKLRNSYKEDLQATCAELVYGTSLRIPGEFFIDNREEPRDPMNFAEDLRKFMRELRSTATLAHSKKAVFVQSSLTTCLHLFLRDDTVRKPLEPPYTGPHKAVFRTEKVYTIVLKSKNVNVTIDRLKPYNSQEERGLSSFVTSRPHGTATKKVVLGTVAIFMMVVMVIKKDS